MSPVYINGVEQVAIHAAKHQDGGLDEISVAALSGTLADRQLSKAGAATLGWTDEKLLKGAGVGVALDEIDVPAAAATVAYLASATLRNSNDGIKSTEALVYTKRKEMLLNANLSACRIGFTLAGDSPFGKIYKNGVAIGTERVVAGTFTEDFTGFVSGDLIQIYLKSAGGAGFPTSASNMRLYYDQQITYIGGYQLVTALLIVSSAISVTNQDPA